jgi:hypothetical protein
MGTLIGKIISTFFQVAAGVGISHMVDKVAADKLPNYPAGGISPANEGIPKLVYVVISGVIGILVWNFISKKLKLKF